MHQKMTFKIKNWKLAILALVFICFFTALGCWQVSRANQKKILLKSFAERTEHVPFTADAINQNNDLRFYRAKLEGTYDNEHTLLLDNTIFKGRVGYEIYTPFLAKGMPAPILIDRGFVPIGKSRQELPAISPVNGTTTIMGMLNQPPKYVAYGQINDSPVIRWPLRVEYVNTRELGKLLGYPVSSFVLNLSPDDPGAYEAEWHVVTMGPERHMGYAVQWFALALTLLILFVALNRNTG
jgi:surfeit locus 1 family protein